VWAQNPLKFAGVPQSHQQISAISRPKFIILSRHVEEVLLFNKFFFQLSIPVHALVLKILPDKVVRWCQNGDFLCRVFSASRLQHISDMHSKLALGHTMCGSMVDIQSAMAEIRRGIKNDKKKPQGKNIMSASAMQGGHKKWVLATTDKVSTWQMRNNALYQ